ncbi:hypothetical protein B0T20DRAFT_424580 [Sordaria brevicollis]|uniref:RanBP2-type domain-containing protein n=1 Tax=Sordaria brevicollis TaxID=83679 RepID=A0AAE0U2R5_SORBR|nr:hypothetical protein B0T20DRAFT_424580 [Sordaria brevicollis]
MKGYTGEGFLGEGRRLGGSSRGRLPMHEARRLAREQAERRKVQTQQSAGSGQRLGGARPRPGEDIRRVIVEAVERRNKTLKGCGVKDTGDEGLGEQEIRRIEEQATRNGFRSKAEEDEANEAAIAQALWELVQEDEKAKFGEGYVEPSSEFPAGSQGAILQEEEKGKTLAGSSSTTSSKQPPPIPYHSKPPATVSSRPPPPHTIPEEPSDETSSDGWACRICTLHNPDSFLCCDACGTQRPPRTVTATNKSSTKNTSSSASSKPSSSTSKRPSSSVIDLTSSPPSVRTKPSSSSSHPKHSSSHKSSSAHRSKSKSSSNSNSKSHSHSRRTEASSSSRPGPSRSEARPEPNTSENSGSLKDLLTKNKKEAAEKSKSKARSLLQAQAEADAARHRLLTETWMCSFCGKRMEKQWWSCEVCGTVKDRS